MHAHKIAHDAIEDVTTDSLQPGDVIMIKP